MISLSYKIKVDTSELKAKYDKFKKEALKDIKQNIGGYITDNIAAGLSPVEGFKEFKAYSKPYTKAILKTRGFGLLKNTSPVNLTLTGKLIKSLKVVLGTDRVNIRFDNEKFVYHNNDGAGKSKVKRRMLPTEQGEKFNKQITISIKESLSRLIQKIFTR
jgi:hypothetical protein